MMIDDLERFIQLDDEVGAVCAVLDRADGLIDEFRFEERDRHVVEALLAIGIEKMAKLTFGLAVESKTGSWPGVQIRKFGHRITGAHAACVQLVTSNLHQGTNPKVVEMALASVRADAFLERLLLQLENYAFTDRYFNLNKLAGEQTNSDSPKAFWATLSDEVWDLEMSGTDVTSNSSFDQWERHRSAYLRKSVLRLRSFYVQAWIQGVCGPTAKKHGFGLQGVTPLLVDND